MRSRTSKNNLLLLVMLMIGFIGMGYALLTTDINITGTGKIKDAKWDVHFENIRVTDGSVAATTAANITDKTSTEFSVTLSKPGDFYEFTMDVVNAGTIDAMVDSFSTTPTVLPDCVLYTVTWSNGDAPKTKDSIPKGKTYKIQIRVEMLKSITADQLLTTEQTLTLGVQLNCVQATGEVQEIAEGFTVNHLPINPASVTNYADGDKTAMYTIAHPDGTVGYRYIGDVPNNYIAFNNEVWRIIGVFDGKLKIVRTETIRTSDGMDYYSYDRKQIGVGSSVSDYGSNDWRDSQLMYMLNPNVPLLSGYSRVDEVIRDNNGYIVYKEGKWPFDVSTTTTEYPADGDAGIPWTLNAEAQNQVSNMNYYTGGDGSIVISGSAEELYTFERSGYVWNGKVALMYASDYGYTFAAGVNDACFGKIYDKDDDFALDCRETWMQTLGDTWTLTVSVNSKNEEMKLNSGGPVADRWTNNSYQVLPVVYLNPDIRLTGTGTFDDHYKIK